MAEPAVADDRLGQDREGFPDAPAALDPERRAEGLWRLFERAHVQTQAHIVQLAERAERTGAVARRLRVAALWCLSLGALALALARPLENLRETQAASLETAIGYVLLALAGGLALLDPLFGASRSWRRARQAQARLEALAVSLRYAWAARLARSGGAVADAAMAQDLADLIRTHGVALEALTLTKAATRQRPGGLRTRRSHRRFLV